MEDFLANKKLSANDLASESEANANPAENLISDEEAQKMSKVSNKELKSSLNNFLKAFNERN